MDGMPPRMERLLGRVSVVRGVEAAVGLGAAGTVVVVVVQGGVSERREHDYDVSEARRLAALLEDAAGVVDGVAAARGGGARTARFDVRAQWPTVAVWLHDTSGALPLGLDFNPEQARQLASLLHRAADQLEP